MNRLLSRLFLMIVMSLGFSSLVAEEIDVTKFLGIPVDGYKPEMIKKLKAKGFVYSEILDRFEGEFNGRDVYLYIATNNNKVYRIFLRDKYSVSETNIKIRYNKLCQQFENNKRYFNFGQSQVISDDEDISYKMSVKNKRYEASYLQLPEGFDSDKIVQKTLEHFQTIYPGLTNENMTEEIAKEMFSYSIAEFYEICKNKTVWFMISEEYGEYSILMYYDNLYNQANGEDL